MRTLKSNGGLTRVNGKSDEQRIVWTMAVSVFSVYNLAMRYLTNTTYTSSEQHKDIAQSRVERDASYLEKLSTKLRSCSPFAPDHSLRKMFTRHSRVERDASDLEKLSSKLWSCSPFAPDPPDTEK